MIRTEKDLLFNDVEDETEMSGGSAMEDEEELDDDEDDDEEGELFDVDSAKEKIHIVPNIKSFNKVKVKGFEFVDDPKYPRVDVIIRELQPSNEVAEERIAIFNPFTQKVKPAKKPGGEPLDMRKVSVSNVKHLIGALTDKDIEGVMGKIKLKKSDLKTPFFEMMKAFIALLPEDYSQTVLTMKLTYYKNSLTFPSVMGGSWVSSKLKDRLDKMKWNPLFDKDVPQGGTSGGGSSTADKEDEELPF